MNKLLKYIIFFLLGVIIYYFLFNNTNNEAKKLIEGFSTIDIVSTNPIYIKNNTIVIDGSSITGVPFSSYGEFDVATHLTSKIEESIFYSHFLSDSDKPGINTTVPLNKSSYDRIIEENTGSYLKDISFLPSRLPNPVIPQSISFTLELKPMSSDVTSAPASASAPASSIVYTLYRKDTISAADITALNANEVFGEGASITGDNSILYVTSPGDDAAAAFAAAEDVDVSTSDQLLLFKFNLSDDGNSPKVLESCTIFLKIPSTIPNSDTSGPNLLGPVDLDNIDNNFGSLISDQKTVEEIDRNRFLHKGDNYYTIKTSIGNIGVLEESLRISNRIKRLTQAEEGSIVGESQEINPALTLTYNLNLIFPTISNEAFTITGFRSTLNEQGTFPVIDRNIFTIATDTLIATVADESRVAEAFNELNAQSYIYEAVPSQAISIFKYVKLYYNTLEQELDFTTDRSDNSLINSLFLDMRIFNVDDTGRFGTLKGCYARGNPQEICDTFTREQNKPDNYFLAKSQDDANNDCDPSPVDTIASQIAGTTGSCYKDENLCCNNNSCSNWLSTGQPTGSAQCARLGKGPNYAGVPTENQDHINVCCGVALHGYLYRLFTEIKDFGNNLYERSNEQTPTSNHIHRDYIKYYILKNMLDIEQMIDEINSITDTSSDTMTKSDYDAIIDYITGGFDVFYVEDMDNNAGNIKIRATGNAPNKVFPSEAVDDGEGEVAGTLGGTTGILSHIKLNPNLQTTLSSETAAAGQQSSPTISQLNHSIEATQLPIALHSDLGPVLSVDTVEEKYNNFVKFFGVGTTVSSSSQTQGENDNLEGEDATSRNTTGENVDNAPAIINFKLSLGLLFHGSLPSELGLTYATPFEQAFPEDLYNLSTFSIYL